MELLTAPPKSVQVADFLAAKINAGEYPPDSRLNTVRALAKQFNTSTQVIVSAFDRLEQKGLIRRVRGSGTYVMPPPSKSQLYGVFSNLQPESYAEYFKAVTTQAEFQNSLYAPIDCSRDADCLKPLERACTHGLGGLFVDTSWWHPPASIAQICGNTPVCYVHRWDWEETPIAPAVLIDFTDLAKTAISYLLTHNHRRIAIVGAFENSWSRPQSRSIIRAAEALGLRFPSFELAYCSVRDFQDNPDRIAETFGGDGRPTAIFGSTDHLAHLYFEQLRDLYPDCADCEILCCYNTDWSQQPGREFHSFSIDYDALFRDAFDQIRAAQRSEEVSVVWHKATMIERPNGRPGN